MLARSRTILVLQLCLVAPLARAGHPANKVDMSKKGCAVTGGTPTCAAWCSEHFIQQHCPDCQCAACDFCSKGKETCEPLPNSDDTRVQQCQPFCAEKDKKQHCLRCSCQACEYCPGADRLSERDVGCAKGQCSEFCDPLYKQQHCSRRGLTRTRAVPFALGISS